jgi:hypothetical protein
MGGENLKYSDKDEIKYTDKRYELVLNEIIIHTQEII